MVVRESWVCGIISSMVKFVNRVEWVEEVMVFMVDRNPEAGAIWGEPLNVYKNGRSETFAGITVRRVW